MRKSCGSGGNRLGVNVPQWLLAIGVTALVAQLIAFAGFQIRQYVQSNQMAKQIVELIKFKEEIEKAAEHEGRDVVDIKIQMASFQTQLGSMAELVRGIAIKVDTLIEKVAKQDGRSSRGNQ